MVIQYANFLILSYTLGFDTPTLESKHIEVVDAEDIGRESAPIFQVFQGWETI